MYKTSFKGKNNILQMITLFEIQTETTKNIYCHSYFTPKKKPNYNWFILEDKIMTRQEKKNQRLSLNLKPKYSFGK